MSKVLLILLLVVWIAHPGVSATPSLRSVADVQRRLAKMEFMAAMMLQPACVIENGFDYVGNDLKNVGGTVEFCCGQCYTTPGCKAFSWSNHNGGTCWLKSGRGQIVVNPNVKSALMLFGQPLVCQLQQDIDYVDNDLARISATKAEDCCGICRGYLGCRAYSWSDFMGGSCWLKSKKGQEVYKAGVRSAEAYPTGSGGQTCTLQADTDYVGNDIGNAYSPTPDGCCQICKNMNGCRAFSWTGLNGGTCWLKNLKGNVISKAGVTSAQVYGNPPPTCTLENDIDYVNFDIGNAPSADPILCCSICKERSGCKAFSWSNHEGGTCWLKSAKGATITKPGVKSAVV
ncbi:hypothetical protein Poli38472_008044 [Pythium oligandrum]|uniref:Apple domain-containing protein n=1 Tax=Pythium oligandrum TaxID=41045 RepID=A0A8K1FN13_PYTOL|nr:hypothetical protein Poli38472_008044 [Pythium oligandrum]|eukprot:TMW65402.1 hypothetical protein Poli38472_008044 [Pythium oligandrum]